MILAWISSSRRWWRTWWRTVAVIGLGSDFLHGQNELTVTARCAEQVQAGVHSCVHAVLSGQ